MSENERNGAPGVDVVVPCYQYGRFLRDCVTSVLTQDVRPLRVLIIDNASTDNSVEVAQQLAAEDRRVEVIARRRNLGPHASFNEGIDWASSKYFMVLCADDLLAPGCLARAVSIMQNHRDVGFAYGRPFWLGPQDPIPKLAPEANEASWRIVPCRDLLERFCRDAHNHVVGPVIVRTEVQKLAGYYRPQLPHTDDFEMWMRLARLQAAAETRAYQGILRLHESSRSAFARRDRPSNIPRHEREHELYYWHDEAAFESFFKLEGRLLSDSARLHRLAKRSLAERAYWAALTHLCRGQTGKARDLWRFATERRPSTAILPPVGYLFRREDAVERIIEVASEVVRWPRASATPARVDG